MGGGGGGVKGRGGGGGMKGRGDVAFNISLTITITMGFWGTGVEPGTQYTEKVSCTVWKMMMMMTFATSCTFNYNV